MKITVVNLTIFILFIGNNAYGQFKINGSIKLTEAWQKKIYVFEMNTLDNADLLVDSINISPSGNFNFIFTASRCTNNIYKLVLPPMHEKPNTLIEGYKDNYFFILPQNNSSCIITAQADSLFYSIKIKGSEINKSINYFSSFKRPFSDLCKQLEYKIQNQPDSIAYYQNLYADDWIQTVEFFKNKTINYLSKTKHSAVLLIGLYHLYRANFGKLNDPQIIYFFNKISNKKIPLYNNLKSKINSKGNNRREVKLPNSIRLLDTARKTIHYNFKNNSFTIISFWASWCSPCREANKNNLRTLYHTLLKKNIQLISISIDTDFEEWTKASLKDNTPWKQFIEDKTTVLQKMLDVSSVPLYLVINTNQEVIFETSSSTLLSKFIEKIK